MLEEVLPYVSDQASGGQQQHHHVLENRKALNIINMLQAGSTPHSSLLEEVLNLNPHDFFLPNKGKLPLPNPEFSLLPSATDSGSNKALTSAQKEAFRIHHKNGTALQKRMARDAEIAKTVGLASPFVQAQHGSLLFTCPAGFSHIREKRPGVTWLLGVANSAPLSTVLPGTSEETSLRQFLCVNDGGALDPVSIKQKQNMFSATMNTALGRKQNPINQISGIGKKTEASLTAKEREVKAAQGGIMPSWSGTLLHKDESRSDRKMLKALPLVRYLDAKHNAALDVWPAQVTVTGDIATKPGSTRSSCALRSKRFKMCYPLEEGSASTPERGCPRRQDHQTFTTMVCAMVPAEGTVDMS
ncbi:unnamed protein product [Amoebophrya sp. A25]|nr:unnamed protein product [Amoebophrya sp. A25]|eukprot:GSA25T00007914001.1